MIHHCLWEHCFYHFVKVVWWFEFIRTLNPIIIYHVTAWILVFRLNCLTPVKANITCSLVSQFQIALCLPVWHPSEDQEGLLGFANVRRIFVDEWFGDIDVSGFIDGYKNENENDEKLKSILTFFFILIQHYIADIFNIEEVLGFKAFNQFRNYLFLHPNEHQTIFHHWGGNSEIADEVINCNSVFLLLRVSSWRQWVHAVPWWIYQNGLDIMSMLLKLLTLNFILAG